MDSHGLGNVLEAHSALNAFRRQRFGIVRGRCFAWFLMFDIS